jgi:hypothetical protein
MRHTLRWEEPEWCLKISRGSRFENLVQRIAITLLWRRSADTMLSIFMNFPYSSVFHNSRFSVMCQEKHIHFMYLHMDLQCPTGSSSMKTARCLCFPETLYLIEGTGKNGLKGKVIFLLVIKSIYSVKKWKQSRYRPGVAQKVSGS